MLEMARRAGFKALPISNVYHTRSGIQSCCLQIWVVVAGKAVRCRHCPATVMRNEADYIATACKGGKALAQEQVLSVMVVTRFAQSSAWREAHHYHDARPEALSQETRAAV